MNAWAYARAHAEEIESQIREDEPRSPEGVLDRNPEIFLACVQILRPDPPTTAPLRGCHNHAVIEVHT